MIFCWLCIIVCQYNETNVMHILCNLFRINGLYMFRALFAHPQKVLHKQHLVYWVRVISVGCTKIIIVKLQSWHNQLTLYARNIPSAVCAVPPEDEQVMLETCRGHWFSINWMINASRWFHCTDFRMIFFHALVNRVIELQNRPYMYNSFAFSVGQDLRTVIRD
jgi:hypothetical protein